jgi:hypothetical protein
MPPRKKQKTDSVASAAAAGHEAAALLPIPPEVVEKPMDGFHFYGTPSALIFDIRGQQVPSIPIRPHGLAGNALSRYGDIACLNPAGTHVYCLACSRTATLPPLISVTNCESL